MCRLVNGPEAVRFGVVVELEDVSDDEEEQVDAAAASTSNKSADNPDKEEDAAPPSSEDTRHAKRRKSSSGHKATPGTGAAARTPSPGRVRVQWHPKGAENDWCEDKLTLVDRSLLPGDVVRRLVRGRNTQRGLVRAVDIFVAGQVQGTDRVAFDVRSRDLESVMNYEEGLAVCVDDFIGQIRHCYRNVVVQFADGTLCELTDEQAEGLEDEFDSAEEVTQQEPR